MNKEKVLELAHQADFINKRHNGAEWRWGYIDPELNQKIEKFAILIVRECANWIKNTDSDSDIGQEDANALLEHFGVEE
jgi:hypothetical protein